MKPTKIAFEKHYSDGSGVEYAVRYDATRVNSSDGGPVIELEAVGCAAFPADMVSWLIACLQEIEVQTNDGL